MSSGIYWINLGKGPTYRKFSRIITDIICKDSNSVIYNRELDILNHETIGREIDEIFKLGDTQNIIVAIVPDHLEYLSTYWLENKVRTYKYYGRYNIIRKRAEEIAKLTEKYKNRSKLFIFSMVPPMLDLVKIALYNIEEYNKINNDKLELHSHYRSLLFVQTKLWERDSAIEHSILTQKLNTFWGIATIETVPMMVEPSKQQRASIKQWHESRAILTYPEDLQYTEVNGVVTKDLIVSKCIACILRRIIDHETMLVPIFERQFMELYVYTKAAHFWKPGCVRQMGDYRQTQMELRKERRRSQMSHTSDYSQSQVNRPRQNRHEIKIPFHIESDNISRNKGDIRIVVPPRVQFMEASGISEMNDILQPEPVRMAILQLQENTSNSHDESFISDPFSNHSNNSNSFTFHSSSANKHVTKPNENMFNCPTLNLNETCILPQIKGNLPTNYFENPCIPNNIPLEAEDKIVCQSYSPLSSVINLNETCILPQIKENLPINYFENPCIPNNIPLEAKDKIVCQSYSPLSPISRSRRRTDSPIKKPSTVFRSRIKRSKSKSASPKNKSSSKNRLRSSPNRSKKSRSSPRNSRSRERSVSHCRSSSRSAYNNKSKSKSTAHRDSSDHKSEKNKSKSMSSRKRSEYIRKLSRSKSPQHTKKSSTEFNSKRSRSPFLKRRSYSHSSKHTKKSKSRSRSNERFGSQTSVKKRSSEKRFNSPPSDQPSFSVTKTDNSTPIEFKDTEQYNIALKVLRTRFDEQYLVYLRFPESHPKFESYYKFFSEKYDSQDYAKNEQHKKHLWEKFWITKFCDIKIDEWKSKLIELDAEFKDKLFIDRICSTPISVCHNEESSVYSFNTAINALEKLCDKIGFLGTTFKAMISSYRELGANSKEAYAMFTERENVVFVNMVLEKVKTLKLSASGDTLQLCDRAIKWIPMLLDEARMKNLGYL